MTVSLPPTEILKLLFLEVGQAILHANITWIQMSQALNERVRYGQQELL